MVLAAGAATRMGLPKATLPFASTTMVGAVVDAAAVAALDPIVVVTGFHAEETTEAVSGEALTVHNPDPAAGNMSSLLTGIEAVGDVDGVVVLLADMPRVESDLIVKLVNGVSHTGRRAGWVEYPEGRGHPIVLAQSAFADVRKLTGTKALWPFFEALSGGEVFALHTATQRPIDVNTPADYERIAGPATD